MRAALVLAAAAMLARPAFAQEARRWEMGVFLGGSFGSRISLTPTTDTRIGNGPAFGFRGAYGLNDRFRLEFSFSRANMEIAARDVATRARLGPGSPEQTTTYELDALYGFGGRRLRGYLGVGAGAMTLSSPARGTPSNNDTRFVASLAIGAEVALNNRLGLRFDGRYRWRASDRRLGTTICESNGCFPFTTDLYSSYEATGGVTYRFGLAPGEEGYGSSHGGSTSARVDTDADPPKRFWTASLEVALLDFAPFAFNRWGSKADWARITPDAIRANFVSGFTYDRDPFSTNQFEHAFHGAVYFSAARANGYDFWESGAFALLGSYLWECCSEIEPPAINDLVNTTFGGMTTGEISHRLSRMLIDNTSGGLERALRELGVAFLDPVGEINRVVHGEATRSAPNPEGRFPSRFRFDAEVGYRHVPGAPINGDQAIVTVSTLYGDPLEGDIQKPFDSFSFGLDYGAPAAPKLSRLEQRGILRGWEVIEPTAKSRHVLGVFMGYEYLNNQMETFSTESFSVGLLSRYRLGSELSAVTDVSAQVFPLAAIRTTDSIDALSGRNYDYAPGGGLRVEGVLRAAGLDIVTLAYRVAWAATTDGPSKDNTLQSFRASARVPIGKRFGLGASYSWYSRHTGYVSSLPQQRTQTEWRFFLTRSL